MAKNELPENQATPEELRAEILMNEDDILKMLTNPVQHETQTETIDVTFGTLRFQFRIRPLSESEWDKCRERNTKYSRNRRLGGMKLPESTDTVAYHSDLIYTATVDDDKAKLWNNKRFWEACKAVTGRDMVDKLIPYAGKKAAIVERIETLSGFDEEQVEAYEETVKN
ncbi:MAG: hypothetical protein RR482_01590 [Clostridia bacterium]